MQINACMYIYIYAHHEYNISEYDRSCEFSWVSRVFRTTPHFCCTLLAFHWHYLIHIYFRNDINKPIISTSTDSFAVIKHEIIGKTTSIIIYLPL